MNPLLLIPDIVNPIDGLVGKLRSGKMYRFTFSTENGHSGIQVERLLRRYGIRICGREMSNPNEIGFLVRHRQAAWAEYLMLRAGVPLTCPVLDRRNILYSQAHTDGSMPTPWNERGTRPRGLIDNLLEDIASILHI